MDFFKKPTLEPVCSGLKGIFDDIAEEPLPTHWDELAVALDKALTDGDLYTQI